MGIRMMKDMTLDPTPAVRISAGVTASSDIQA
jgi:hypothetical protein